MRKPFTLLVAGAALAASGAAMASDVRFSVSVGVPAPYLYSPPVVVAPAPVYYPPRVVYAPAPVYSYYGPPRAIYGPRVVVAPAPWWAHGHRHGRYWGRDDDDDRGRYEHRRW